MARVAVAFVEIRPELGTGPTGFAERLKAALTKVNVTEPVKIVPDTKGFGAKVATAVKGSGRTGAVKGEADALGELIGEEASKHITDSWDVDADKLMEPMGEVGDSMNAIMSLLGDEADKAFVNALKRRHTKRMVDAMSANFNKVEAEEKIRARLLAETFADNYQRSLMGRNKDISKAEAANFKIEMMRRFGPVGEAMADQTVKSFNDRLARQRALVAANAAKLAEAIETAHGKAIEENKRRTEKDEKDRADAAAKAVKASMAKFADVATKESRKAGAKAGDAFADTFAKQMRLGINLRLGQLLPIIVSIAFAAAPLAGMLSSLAAGATALVAAIGEGAVAAAGGFAASLLALGQAFGVAKFAMAGFSDALKAQNVLQQKMAAGMDISAAEIAKYNESLGALAPNARRVVTALGRVSGQFVTIRRNVQQRLFAGVATEIRGLASAYLPTLNNELLKTAGVLNKAGRGFSSFMRQASTVRQVRDLMSGNTAIVEQFTKAIVPLTRAALRLFRALQPLGIQVDRYAEQWARAVDASLRTSESSGRLTTTIDNLGKALDQAVRIVKNLWSAGKATFGALLGPGRTLLTMFENLTRRWAQWANTISGRNAIEAWGMVAIPVMHEMGLLIGDLFRAFGRLAKVGDAGGFVAALRSIIPPLEGFLTQLSASGAAEKFAQAMGQLLQTLVDINAGGALASITVWAARFLGFLNDLIRTVPGLSTALKGLAFVLATIAALRFVSALTGLSKLPQLVVTVKNFTTALFGLRAAQAATETFAFKLGDRLKTLGVNAAIAGAQMRTAAGRTLVMGAAVRTLSAAIAANPFGAIVVGVGLVATAIWGIAKAAQASAGKVRSLGVELQKIGATQTAGSVEEETKRLRDELQKTLNEMLRFGKSGEEFERVVAQMQELEGASTRMSAAYGKGVDTIINDLRAMGLANTTSSTEVLVAMDRIKKTYGNVPVSADQMTRDLANIYGLMVDNTQTASSQVAGYVNDAANAYGNLSRAAIDAALKQVEAAAKSGNIYAGAGRLLGQQQAALNALKDDIPTFSTNIASSYGAASSAIASTATKAGASAGKKTAAGFISNFTPALKALNPADLIAHSATWVKNGKNIAMYLAKGITSGSKNLTRVSNYIYKKYKPGLVKIQNEIAKYKAAATPFVKELNKSLNLTQLNTLLTNIKNFKTSAFEALTSGRTLTNFFGYIPTPGEIKNQLAAQLANLTTFTTRLADLRTKGLDPEWAKELMLAGPEAAGTVVEGLSGATKDQIAEMSRQFRDIGSVATTQATAASDSYFKVGEAQVVGYIKGIKTNQDAAVKAMTDIIAAQITAVKKKLGIKSPSTVFDTFGVNTVAGYIQGVESKQNATVAAIDNLYSAVTAVPPATLSQPKLPAGPTYAKYPTPAMAGAQVPPVFDVRVFIGERELTDIVRVEIDQSDNTQARNLLAGRRGG